MTRHRPGLRSFHAVATAAYAGMLIVFFAFNAAVNDWTPATLPADWPAYRLRWEIGHAIAALLAMTGLWVMLRGMLATRPHRPVTPAR